MARILLIDDDQQLLQLMEITLKKAQHKVTAVSNGKLGLTQLAQYEFDLVITDIIMPEKDGIEVIIAMSRMEKRPALLAISGGSQRLDAIQLLKTAKVMKVDMVLAKPITPSGLLEAVETLLLNNAT